MDENRRGSVEGVGKNGEERKEGKRAVEDNGNPRAGVDETWTRKISDLFEGGGGGSDAPRKSRAYDRLANSRSKERRENETVFRRDSPV